MELLLDAFASCLTIHNLLMLIAGVLLGLVIGALPGLTAMMGIAIFSPLTFFAPPEQGLCLLLGLYNAAMFGGAISAILINTPGTPAAIATTFDGYPMSRKGEAGLALSLSALSSFGGGIFSIFVFMLIAFPLAKVALQFGPAQYFALAIFGLSMMIAICGQSIIKGLTTGFFGLWLASIGLDPLFGTERFTFGLNDLIGGVSFIPMMIGLFGISELGIRILQNVDGKGTILSSVGPLWPKWHEIKRVTPAFFLSSVVGTIVGVIPATGGDIASLISWDLSKNISKKPDEFGKGSMEGLVASETANNSVIGGAMTTMLTLGIPGDTVTALLIGTLMIWGLQPGPLLFRDHVDIIYKIIAIMILANIFSLIFSFFRLRSVVKGFLKLPNYIFNPMLMMFCIIGAFSIQNSYFDVWLMLGFGAFGLFLRRFGFPLGPMVLGFILGPMAESNLQRSLVLSDGSLAIFFQKPLALILLLFSFGVMMASLLQRKKN